MSRLRTFTRPDGRKETHHEAAVQVLGTQVAMANLNLPERAIRQHIVGGIQFVIQLSRLSDGSQKIMSISEINGAEGDVISLQDLFVFEREGIGEDGKVLGRFEPTGIRPKFADALKAKGVEFDGGTFLDLEEAPGRRGRSLDRRKTS